MPMKTEFALTPAVIAGTPAPMLPRKEMTIQDLWSILVPAPGDRCLACFLFTIGAAAILFATSTRLYKGSAEIQVQKESADALSMDTMMGPESQSDAVDSNITLQTQAQILQSDSLALQVVRELNLENSPDFRNRFNPIGWVLGLLAPAGIPDPSECAAGRRARAPRTRYQEL